MLDGMTQITMVVSVDGGEDDSPGAGAQLLLLKVFLPNPKWYFNSPGNWKAHPDPSAASLDTFRGFLYRLFMSVFTNPVYLWFDVLVRNVALTFSYLRFRRNNIALGMRGWQIVTSKNALPLAYKPNRNNA